MYYGMAKFDGLWEPQQLKMKVYRVFLDSAGVSPLSCLHNNSPGIAWIIVKLAAIYLNPNISLEFDSLEIATHLAGAPLSPDDPSIVCYMYKCVQLYTLMSEDQRLLRCQRLKRMQSYSVLISGKNYRERMLYSQP